jgi:tRNA pseudouridine38-40 synthase
MTESADRTAKLRNWKLTLSYDGTGYRGWQVQPGETTVQGELQAALGRITGETPLPQGSGRTDAGVHALGQVASFPLAVPIPAENLLMALNRTLPPSIRILEARIVSEAFHARHSAVGKTYEYRIFEEKPAPWTNLRAPSRICPPFLVPYVCQYPWPLDYGAMQEAARQFVGQHDFLSFAATDPDLAARRRERDEREEDERADLRPLPRPGFTVELPAPLTVRRIYSSTWQKRETDLAPILVYRVRGSGFLHHMVRNLVGTMLDIGRGLYRADQVPAMLAARRRSAAGTTAPAQGLFLVSVEYGGADDCRLDKAGGSPNQTVLGLTGNEGNASS